MIANGNGQAADHAALSLDAFDRKMRDAISDIYGDYYASENNRYMPTPRGVAAMGSGADYHYRTEGQYLRMLERARWIDRDNMVVGQGVTRLVANIVQDGFTLDVETGDDGLDGELKSRWTEWAEEPDSCDFEGERSWGDFETLALRNTIVDGDLVILPLALGSLQAVEAHRLRTPHGSRENVVLGVELAADRRRREAYHLTAEEINPQRAVGRRNKFSRYPARDSQGRRQVLHLYDPKRFSQTRGVTAFAPAIIPTVYHDDLQFANLVKAKVASFYAIFRQKEIDSPPTGSNRIGGARSTETQSDGSVRTMEQRSPGAEIVGDPGEKLQGFAPNIPNPEFFPHAALILSFIAINLDLPLAVFLLDPSKTNFSGWRGAIDQARLRFRQRQKWLRSRLHTPVYTWKVRQWAAADRAIRTLSQRSDVKVFGHRWNPPTWPYIEPLKDAAGDDLAVSRNLTSQRRRAAARGVPFDDLSTEIVDDRAILARKAHAKALELQGEGLDINWRELAYGHKSDGLQLKFDAGPAGDDDQTTSGKANQ